MSPRPATTPWSSGTPNWQPAASNGSSSWPMSCYPGRDRPFRLASRNAIDYLEPFALTLTGLRPDTDGLAFADGSARPLWVMPGIQDQRTMYEKNAEEIDPPDHAGSARRPPRLRDQFHQGAVEYVEERRGLFARKKWPPGTVDIRKRPGRTAPRTARPPGPPADRPDPRRHGCRAGVRAPSSSGSGSPARRWLAQMRKSSRTMGSRALGQSFRPRNCGFSPPTSTRKRARSASAYR